MRLVITRAEIIVDMKYEFMCENDFSTYTDKMLIQAWKQHGIHADIRWNWDDVCIQEPEDPRISAYKSTFPCTTNNTLIRGDEYYVKTSIKDNPTHIPNMGY